MQVRDPWRWQHGLARCACVNLCAGERARLRVSASLHAAGPWAASAGWKTESGGSLSRHAATQSARRARAAASATSRPSGTAAPPAHRGPTPQPQTACSRRAGAEPNILQPQLSDGCRIPGSCNGCGKEKLPACSYNQDELVPAFYIDPVPRPDTRNHKPDPAVRDEKRCLDPTPYTLSPEP